MANRWGNSGWLYFLGFQITSDGDCSHEIKRYLLLGRKVMTNLDSILKSRDYFANKVPSIQSYGFSSGHVWMWKLDYKESWAPNNWCFWTVVLEKTLESPLDCKEIQPVHPNGDQSWVLLEGLRLKLKLQYFGHLMWRTDSLEKTLMLGGIEGRRSGRQKMTWLDDITNAMDMNLSKLPELVLDREGWYVAVHGVAKCQTQLSNWTDLNSITFGVSVSYDLKSLTVRVYVCMHAQSCPTLCAHVWTHVDKHVSPGRFFTVKHVSPGRFKHESPGRFFTVWAIK